MALGISPGGLGCYPFLGGRSVVVVVDIFFNIRLNSGPDLVPDACLWLGSTWLNLRFSLALTICES